jgi:AcrR family transcriptional regulator
MAMASERRLGSTTSATRDLIIRSAVEVLQQEGAARLTAGRVAEKAGVKAHLVHYYFRTMDDLVLAVVRTHGQAGLKHSARAIASNEPLRALWDLEMAYKWSAAAVEFSAIASHNPAIQDEITRYLQEIRSIQAEAIERHFELHGFECPFPPLAIAFVMTSIARQLNRERGQGVTLGHEETIGLVTDWLASLPTAPKDKAQAKPAPKAPRRRAG